MQQILREKHSGITKQMTNWSVLTFKRKLKLFRFIIVKYETQAFNRKFEIKPVFISISLWGCTYPYSPYNGVALRHYLNCAIPKSNIRLGSSCIPVISDHYRHSTQFSKIVDVYHNKTPEPSFSAPFTTAKK